MLVRKENIEQIDSNKCNEETYGCERVQVRASSTIREPTGQAKREEVRQEGAEIIEDCVEAWGPGGGIWILP